MGKAAMSPVSSTLPTQPIDPAEGSPGPRRTETETNPDGGVRSGELFAGRYRIVDRIGRGGMGEVFRAEDLELDQTVALKFLPAVIENDPDRRARLRNEVRAARSVSHPNVCRVYDIGESEGRLFLSMELVDGEDLACLLHRRGRLPFDEALGIARQIAFGLAAAHECGVLHRDLKPANVMIDSRGIARIADFGLAELSASVRDHRAREGTPSYMSPEQLEGREATSASDLYALGLVFYELFTGEKLGGGRSVKEPGLVQSTALELPPLLDDLDPSIGRIIRRCLEADPARRLATARSAAAALPGGGRNGAAFDAAQQRADRVAAFRAELTELRRENVIELGPALLAAIETYHRKLIRDLAETFDVDIDDRTKRLSLGMRLVSLSGAIALGASAFFFFHRIWGLIGLTAQIALLAGAPAIALLLTSAIAAREKARDLTSMAGLFALSWLAVDVSALSKSLGVTPSSGGFLICGLFGLIMAFGFRARLLFVAGLACIGIFSASSLALWKGLAWWACFERGEGFMLTGVVILLLAPAIRDHHHADFPIIARLLGLLSFVVPAIVLGMEPETSFLPFSPTGIGIGYQLVAFLASSGAIWAGLSRRRVEWVWGGSGLLVVLLYTELVHWCWDLVPRYLFFLFVAAVAIVIVVMLRRLRTRVTSFRAEGTT